jgi:hypothetical protein
MACGHIGSERQTKHPGMVLGEWGWMVQKLWRLQQGVEWTERGMKHGEGGKASPLWPDFQFLSYCHSNMWIFFAVTVNMWIT